MDHVTQRLLHLMVRFQESQHILQLKAPLATKSRTKTNTTRPILMCMIVQMNVSKYPCLHLCTLYFSVHHLILHAGVTVNVKTQPLIFIQPFVTWLFSQCYLSR